MPSLEKVVFFNDGPGELPDVVSLTDFELEGSRQRLVPKAAALDRSPLRTEPDDIATLIYTSGTTGEPKGVMLTHANIISNVIDASEKYAFRDGRYIAFGTAAFACFRATGMYVYILIRHGGHFAESIEKVPDNLQEVRPTIFIGVPRIFEKVYEKAQFKAAQAGGVKEKIFDWAIESQRNMRRAANRARADSACSARKHTHCGQARVSQSCANFSAGVCGFASRAGRHCRMRFILIFTGAGISIMQGYGLTETSPVISSNNPSTVKLGTVGQADPQRPGPHRRGRRDRSQRAGRDARLLPQGGGDTRGIYR